MLKFQKSNFLQINAIVSRINANHLQSNALQLHFLSPYTVGSRFYKFKRKTLNLVFIVFKKVFK